ncbi:MAG: peptide chain release factor 3 [Bdellovibrionales bacterium GWB1_55_8]|nr:MAG: peptide chain release factor 3 [Bdellovibrionales bacterium GWB1_55_8]
MSLVDLQREVARRRTFAIISHPDAGKTTLTEKLLLYGGAIHLAGAVRAKANQRHTTSDWMEIEKQRGISISSSVLQFEYQGVQVNLLDTPGHKDFSEDTYRTLTAADAAVMLIDAAKGVEPQTRKLFEVCRMRGIPIFTFMNKLDRPSRDPLDLLDELEKVLGIRTYPMTWPIGAGDRFKGVYDRHAREVLLYQTEGEANVKGRLAPKGVSGVDDPAFIQLLAGPEGDADEAKELHDQLRSELELIEMAGDAFDKNQVLAGQLSPVFFGSAMNNFGIERFLQRFIEMAPAPAPRTTVDGPIEPIDPRFSGFIFKIQANMDPSHRDRVAFMRVCSGKFTRNMSVNHVRMKKEVKLSRPLNFFAQERVIIEEAWPGDIVGLLDTTGDLRIGDTLCERAQFEYEGVPRFSPEHFVSVMILDPMKRKQLKKGLEQLAEEGVVQIYKQRGLGDKDPILGAVGALQFEVLQFRLKAEYGVDVRIERLPYIHARWVTGAGLDADYFERREDSRCLEDRDGQPVILFKSDWGLRWAQENYKALQFHKTAPMVQG